MPWRHGTRAVSDESGVRSSSPGRLSSASSADVRSDLERPAVWGGIDRVRPPLSAPVVVTVVVSAQSSSGAEPAPCLACPEARPGSSTLVVDETVSAPGTVRPRSVLQCPRCAAPAPDLEFTCERWRVAQSRLFARRLETRSLEHGPQRVARQPYRVRFSDCGTRPPSASSRPAGLVLATGSGVTICLRVSRSPLRAGSR